MKNLNCWWRSDLSIMSAAVKFLPKCFGNFLHRISSVLISSGQIKSDFSNVRTISTIVHHSRTLQPHLPGPQLQVSPNHLHTSPPLCDAPSPAEESLISALAASFPTATDIAVVDISGGCGSMYEVYVEAPDFKGVRMVKQHQMVTKALSSQIKDMHGIRISTSPSPCKPPAH